MKAFLSLNRRVVAAILLLSLAVTARADNYGVYDLRCEHLHNPVGVDGRYPRFSWKLTAEARNTRQTAYELEVFRDNQVVWTTGKRNGEEQVLVPYKGPALLPATRYEWRVKSYDNHGNVSDWSPRQHFITGLPTDADWRDAKWIALEKDGPTMPDGLHLGAALKDKRTAEFGKYRMPQFRRVVSWNKPIAQAVAYVCGLGQFEFMLNGQKVDRHYLDPGWSADQKEALYVAFDLTDSLRHEASGKAVLGIMLGNGFYNIPTDRYFKLSRSGGAPKLRFKLVIRYADGTQQTVVSDRSWKVCPSPVTFSSIYGGEDYDARLERDGWARDANYDDSHWQKPVVARDWGCWMKAQTGARLELPVRLNAMTCYQNSRGQWVYDLGQNFAGIIDLDVEGKNGARVVLRPGELLNADSTVNQDASGKPFFYAYTCKGNGEEHFRPRFTYYGQRYVQLEGAVPAGAPNPQGLPVVKQLYGLLATSATEQTGQFNCSKPLFNQIHNLIDWAIRSNIVSVTTDCPHREKLGWQEQNHLMQYSINYRYNVAALYEKIFLDQELAQRHDSLPDQAGINHEGCIPSICPEYVRFEGGFEDSPEWGCSAIICPWYNYLWNGDKQSIESHYRSMMAYLNYLSRRAKDGIVSYGLGDWFDIGPKAPGRAQLTTNSLTATAIYYYCASIMQKCAALLGRTADEQRLSQLAGSIRQAYNKAFYHPETGLYERGSQTAQAMSLYMGLVDDGNRQLVFRNLVDSLRASNYTLTAGDVGYRYVLQALMQGGASDVIFNMNSKYDTPGYGWQLAHGATALTESWQAYGFVSNNHLMLGHLMEWLYAGLGGISQEKGSVAFKTIRIDPQVVGDVSYANTSYESPYGTIRCNWQRLADRYVLDVDIPAGANAMVCLPSSLEDLPVAGKRETVRVGSGHYHYEVGSKN